MSIQDDVFDVEHVLRGSPVSEQFVRIYKALWHYEDRCEKLASELRELKQALALVGTYISPEVK